MPAVRWPDGRIDRARSWQMLLDQLNALPWNAELDEKEFREALAHRAYVWCGEPMVHPSSPPRKLFTELQDAGMLRIIERGDKKGWGAPPLLPRKFKHACRVK